MYKCFSRLVLSVLLLSCASLLHAQDAASITGVVTDATGAVIPDTMVVLTNTATGIRYTTKTDSKGTYRFTNVAPAPSYSETLTHEGFSAIDIKDVVLSVGITRTQNVTLNVGTAVEVTVSEANQEATLNTTDASIGNNIDPQQLNELPIQNRTGGISTLFFLQSGVDPNSGAVTGARTDQSSVTVDGMDVNDIASNATFGITVSAPVDSVQEFRGTVAGLVSAIGTGSGAQFQLVTKSGTNKFHGNLNEYHRDTTTIANTYFNNLDGLPRTPLIRNQFGGDIGGPLKRDKLFFFFDFADSRIIQSSTGETTVPLDNFRDGTLNYINDSPGCDQSSRLNTTPGCITNLSGAQVAALDPAHIGFDSNLLSFINMRYPHANALQDGDGVNTGGYRFSYPTPDFDTTYVTRVDYNLSSAHKIFGRFTINRENATESLPVFPVDPIAHPFIDRSYGYVVSDVWTIGSNKVNQFYYGDTISKFNFPNTYNPTDLDQYSISGIGGPYNGTDGQKRRVPIPEVRDDFNLQLGSHSITAGGTFKFIKTNSNLINNFNFIGIGQSGTGLQGGLNSSLRPANIYTNSLNATAINDFDSLFTAALGVIGSISTNYNYDHTGAATPLGTGGPRAYRYFETEAYVGDAWRVTKNLTLSYGLRYQLYSVPYEAHGQESVEFTDQASQKRATLNSYINAREAQIASPNPVLPIYSVVLGGKANNGAPLYQPSYKDFAPRFAFSYSPYGNGKTVVNGGAGIVYDRTVINAINFLQDQISYLFSNTQVNNIQGPDVNTTLATNPRIGANLAFDRSLIPPAAAITSPYTPYVSGGVPYGLGNGETNFVISPNLKDPYSIAINFGVQQELPFHMILRLNYVGRLGRRLLADADAGQVLDTPDVTGKSNQTMVQAFANLTKQTRAQQAAGTLGTAPLTPQPWFENVLGAYQGALGQGSSNTDLVNYFVGQLAPRGDISDMIYLLGAYTNAFLPGFLPNNIGLPAQFGSNAYLTNQGNSNYHGLLFTLNKNMSNGLRFDFNYTFSHSIDNTSLSGANNSLFNNSGFICDITQPRACRGTSDFDVTQQTNANFDYELPFGRGKAFGGSTSHLVNETIGGWSFSGIPTYRTGLAVTSYSDAYLASFDNADPAIFTGNKGDLKAQINKVGKTVYGFAGGQAGANKVLSEFRGPVGLEYGQRNLLRSAGAFNFDAGLAKVFPITNDRLNLIFRADAFNLFNHPNFGTPAVNIVNNTSPFGQITGTAGDIGATNGARVAQFSLRLEF